MASTSSQATNADPEYLYRALSVTDITSLIARNAPEYRPRTQLTKKLKQNKQILLDILLKDDPYWTEELYKIAVHNVEEQIRKRREKNRRHAEHTRVVREERTQETYPGEEFFDLPPNADSMRCYTDAWISTSNAALEQRICAVCARLQLATEAKFTRMPVTDIPNRHRLRPHAPHPDHVLTQGCLLELKGCHGGGPNPLADICKECLNELQPTIDVQTPPKHSLANNLWIGEIPWELAHLTFAENLLIARIFPKMFLIHLFPRDRSKQHLPLDQLQTALRGTVVSFDLNSCAIADMISGNFMPQKPEVLASTLSVTFIGRRRIKDPSSLHMLRVRRPAIARALEWLQKNNKKYYGDIVIDTTRLDALPFDGVPEAISAGFRYQTEESMAKEEYDGYKQNCYSANEETVEGVTPDVDNFNVNDDGGPGVIPLQYLGVMDNDQSGVPTDELMNWGLDNMVRQADSMEESGYAIRWGAPVNTFGQPPAGEGPADPDRDNFWEAAFPFLFTHGVGGIESDRPVPLSLNEHGKWALGYHDKRFRLHHSFIFALFGMLQNRQGLMSTKIQVNRHDFDSIAHTLNTITPADLRQAAEEEKKGEPASNPAIQVLKRCITATSRRVMASGASRTQLRSQIYSAAIYFNQPTIWLTINPDDLHDPIAQIFAGEEIDMDNFIRTAGPDSSRRAQNIAQDPYAAAKFFHFTITLVLEVLFGITTSQTRIHTRKGILGRVKAYFGTVECQGRGTLHLHMLIWLHNVPPPRRLKEMLRTEEFRSKVAAYLKANVRSSRPGLANEAEVKGMKVVSDIAYSRMPNPFVTTEEFAAKLDELETDVVRAKQVHKCDWGKCLKPDKGGKVVCKRGAPWALSDKDSVNQDGTYHTKRTYERINGYCPAISHVLKCNHDMQLLLHGDETIKIAYYISKYMTKTESRSHNVAGLLADNLTKHFSEDPNLKDIFRRQQDLINRAINILNRQQELSAPLVMMHLLGFHDVYRSHHPAYIYWGSFASYIHRTFMELSPRNIEEQAPSATDGVNDLRDTSDQENGQSENVILGFNQDGRLYKRSQVEDYMHRGELTSSYNVLEYFVDTYEQAATRDRRNRSSVAQDLNTPPGDSVGSGETSNRTNKRAGRPTHDRVKYMDAHPRSKTHVRVIRPDNHNYMPNIIGLRFPRKSDPAQTDLYAASILVFLKPWRHPNDIKGPNESWSDALASFLSTASDRVLDIIDNIEHRHEAQSAAEREQEAYLDEVDATGLGRNAMDVDEAEPPSETCGAADYDITEEMIEKAALEMENYREVLHGVQAVRIGQSQGIFGSQQTPVRACDERAARSDLEMLKTWRSLLKQDAEIIRSSHGPASVGTSSAENIATVEPLSNDYDPANDLSNVPDQLLSAPELPVEGIPHGQLFADQQRAFDIFFWHLGQTLYAQEHDPARKPPQLRLLMIGEGGTGKSRVIQTITEEFRKLGIENRLMKAAFTGCTASHIEGHTTHSIAHILVGKKSDEPMSFAARQEMAKVWKPIEYLIIDEYSMLSKEFFAQLSRHISVAKLGYECDDPDFSFGGVNVILCGDIHQIPPVAASAGGALFHPATSPSFKTSLVAGIGRKIYENFKLVVILKQQVRVTDPVWQNFLSNFRVGQVQQSDITLLDSITLTNPKCRATDFTSDRWKDCPLITPRNAVQVRWNAKSVEEHCRRTGAQLLSIAAQDTCIDGNDRRPLTMRERYISMRSAGSKRNPRKGRRERNGLPDEVRMAVDMKVMVTSNVNTDIDVTNGARGVIVGIKLDAREPPFSPTEPQVKLVHLPAYILVKLDRTRARPLPNLEANVIPIVPVTRYYPITVPVKQPNGRTVSIERNVRRRQFPIAPAYAFTDYRAQGQTLANAVIDIAEPPTGKSLSQPNIYVALSRCSGLDSVRILRDFDRTILKKPIDIDLAKEDERLEELNRATSGWWEEVRAQN